MLVLSRSTDQKIIIGDNIVITIVSVKGDRVQVGIDAPTNIPIYRPEVKRVNNGPRDQQRPFEHTGR